MASSPRIEELRKKFEENPRRYFAPLANEYRKAGDIEQAIAICREYLPQQPGHMSGHIVYGQALYEARQVEEAKSVFETALSLDPENLIALRHLGDIALMIGDSPGARMWYGRVLEADPRNEEIQAQLARMDQTESASPTPVVSTAVETSVPPVPPPEASHPTPMAGSPSVAAKPTPSSAPTVVVSAMRVPPAPRDEPVDKPLETITTESAPPEMTLEPTAAAAPSDIEKSAHAPIGLEPTSMAEPQETFGTQPTVPLDTSIAQQIAKQRDEPQIASSSLEGLETTSVSAAPAQTQPAPESTTPALPTPEPSTPQPPRLTVEVPTLELTDASGSLPTPPTPPTEATASAPPAPSPAEEASQPSTDLPLLDLDAPSPTRTPTPASQNTEPALPAASAPESGPFVTETMAELYLHQGHRDEALRVYRALLEQRPGDARLESKVAELSAAAPPATPPPQTPAAAVPASSATPPQTRRDGRTIRDLLAAIAVRRPVVRVEAQAGNGGAPAAAMEPASAPEAPAPPSPVPAAAAAPPQAESTPPAVTQAAPTPEPAAPKPRPDDRLATLFGAAQIAAPDEAAAMVLAQAFMELNGLEQGGGPVSDVGGAPARPANSDLSLDAVFKTEDANAAPPPSSFSFDQFFSQRATAEQPTPGAAGGSAPSTGARDDAAQFTRWLEGLKQR